MEAATQAEANTLARALGRVVFSVWPASRCVESAYREKHARGGAERQVFSGVRLALDGPWKFARELKFHAVTYR